MWGSSGKPGRTELLQVEPPLESSLCLSSWARALSAHPVPPLSAGSTSRHQGPGLSLRGRQELLVLIGAERPPSRCASVRGSSRAWFRVKPHRGNGSNSHIVTCLCIIPTPSGQGSNLKRGCFGGVCVAYLTEAICLILPLLPPLHTHTHTLGGCREGRRDCVTQKEPSQGASALGLG